MACHGQGESNKPKNKLNKSKVLKISIILICVILFISFIVLYQNNENVRNFSDVYIFRKVINEEKVPSIEIDTSKNMNVFAYDKYIAILDQNILKLYNKSGKEEQSLDIQISNPLFETNNNYLCIAEKGGKKLYLISNKNIVWQNEIEGNIADINVNKNGYVSVTITGTSYKTVVQIFDSKGNELFKKYSASTNVIDTDISNDNKYLAMAEANFSGVMVQSNIKIISIEDAQNNSSESIKYTHIADANNLIINIKYNNKNELVCMYDKHIDILKEGQNTELINFDNERLLFVDINLSNKFLKIAQINNGMFNSEIEMQIVNSSTQSINTYKIENTPKKVYAHDNMIVVNLGTSVLFINDSGWLVKRYQSNKEEIQKVVFCNNIAGVICKDRIKIISL